MADSTEEFTVSNDILDDPVRLRQRLDAEGYLFIRGLQDPDLLAALRLDILQVCRGGVFDVDGRNDIVAVSDLPQPSMTCLLDQPGKKVVVTGPPDQVRSQGDGGQVSLSVGRQHRCLGQRLGSGVSAEEPVGIRPRFICIDHVTSVENHAGAAGVDESCSTRVGGCGKRASPPRRMTNWTTSAGAALLMCITL